MRLIPGWNPGEPWTTQAPDYWAGLRQVILERDGFACTYCGSTDQPLHVDHVIPRSRGGRDTLGNLTTACRTCNLRKHAKTSEALREWVAKREREYADLEAAILWGWVDVCQDLDEPVPSWVNDLLEVDARQ